MHSQTPLARRGFLALIAVLAAAAGAALPARAADYPPLPVEISPDHPLLLFQALPAFRSDPAAQRDHVLGAWAQIPESLASNAMIKIDAPGGGNALRAHFETVLAALQEQQIPAVIRIADNPQLDRLDPALLESILAAHTMVKGVEVAGLDFRFYSSPRMQDGQTPAVIAWLTEVIETAARYGRFVYLPMNEVQWARLMSNTACEPLYRKIAACSDYVIPACLTRGDHLLSNQAAALGLWLEGAVSNWGIAADARWYTDASYLAPGEFGAAPGPERIPPSVYRAMLLNGAMTGATVYSFEYAESLWYGPARHHWDESIFPTLREIMAKSAIARRRSVSARARVALQLAPARNPEDFHLNLKDIDAVLNEGNLLRGSYGLERPGQIAELVPNRGDYFWIPFLSPHAPSAAREPFAKIIPAGSIPTAPAWIAALEPFREPIGRGSAFMAQSGFGIFVMNTRENAREPQDYSVARVPRPVRGFKAGREGESVVLTWNFRENDLGYRIYKRVLPETRFALLDTLPSDTYRYTDTGVGADQTIAYAVTAQTMEMEEISGTVGYGEYRLYSTTESRIAEEVVLTPLLANADSTPVRESTVDADSGAPWWPPPLDGVPGDHVEAARAIIAQIENWDRALLERDLNGVMGAYATSYEDPQRWDFAYVRRAYQQMLERWRHLRMHRQIRRWDFSNYLATGQINVLLYVRLSGNLLTDSSGLVADVPVSIPRTEDAEVWTTWSDTEGVWRMIRTNPALPNFREVLSFDAGPYDNFPLGPDQY